MAKYRIKQKYFALNDKFEITDASGNPRYYCKSKLISVTKKFWLESANGNPLYFVRKNVCNWPGFPKFKIYKGDSKDGELVANVKVKFRLFGKKLKVYSDVFGDFTIKGLHWNFNVYNDSDEVVANVQKHVFKIADTYDIDVFALKDSFAVVIGIILDYLYHKKN